MPVDNPHTHRFVDVSPPAYFFIQITCLFRHRFFETRVASDMFLGCLNHAAPANKPG